MKKTDVAKKMKGFWDKPLGVYEVKSAHPKKPSQKGRGSLEIPKSKTGKNEGNKMYEGKNEQERS